VILENDDGTHASPITMGQIDTWVGTANIMYKAHHLELTFNHADAIHVANTTLNNPPVTPENWQPDPDNQIYFSPNQMYDIYANSMASHFPDKIVVLFRGVGGGGFSWGPPHTYYVSMPSYTHTCSTKPTPGICNPNNLLLAHEIGHYLGLAHTFAETRCDLVTATNTDGDRGGQDEDTEKDDVLDTPPDPGPDCAPTTSFNCPSGSSLVVNGVTFTPPYTNFMSYHGCLPLKMTADQKRAINYTLEDPHRSQIPE
jgi:hypothetical protein